MIIATKKDNLLQAVTLIKICTLNDDFTYSSLKNYKFPFNYKGWRFEKLSIKEVIQDRHKLRSGILKLIN